MRLTKIRLPLLVLVATAAIASCSSKTEQVSDKVVPQIKAQLGLDYEPSVTCPDDVDPTKGLTFDCTLEIEGTEVPLEVEFKTDRKFTSSVQGAVVRRDGLQREIIGQFEEERVGLVAIDCPGKELTVIKEGKTVDCAIKTDEGAKGTVVVGITDNGRAVIIDIIPGG